MTLSVKELVKEIDWLLEKIEFSLDEWHDDSILNHSHSPDSNFVLVDMVIVKNNLVSRLEFLKEELEKIKKKVEEP